MSLLQDFFHRGITQVPEASGSYVMPGGCGVFLVGNAYRLARVHYGHPLAEDGLMREARDKLEKMPWLNRQHQRAAIHGLEKGKHPFTEDEVAILIEWIMATPHFKEPK